MFLTLPLPMKFLSALPALLLLPSAVLFGAPKNTILSPIAVVSEAVHVSVGPKMALIAGRYWYQYVPRFDDHTPRIAIHYAAFVPKEASTRRELLEASQIKMMIGEREFLPEDARVLDLAELGAMEALPEDAVVAWFTFQIPRELARLRFDVVISHFQPHYRFKDKTVAAYWPWLPHLEELRLPMELKPIDYLVTFEALAGAKIALISHPSNVKEQSDTKLVVHPLHLENIAVAVTDTPGT